MSGSRLGATPEEASLGRDDGLSAQRVGVHDAVELAFERFLGGKGRLHDLTEFVDFQNTKPADGHIDVDVGLRVLEFLANDGVLQHLRGRHQRFKRGRKFQLVRHRRAAADVDGNRDVGQPLDQVERQRIDHPAVEQQVPLVRDRREQRRQRHGGCDRWLKRPGLKHHRLIGVDIGRDDFQRSFEIGKVARDTWRHYKVEQDLGAQHGGFELDKAHDPVHRQRPRRKDLPDQIEALLQDHLGVSGDVAGRYARRISRPDDRANRRPRDQLGTQTKLVEHFQHRNMRNPPRPAPAKRNGDGW